MEYFFYGDSRCILVLPLFFPAPTSCSFLVGDSLAVLFSFLPSEFAPGELGRIPGPWPPSGPWTVPLANWPPRSPSSGCGAPGPIHRRPSCLLRLSYAPIPLIISHTAGGPFLRRKYPGGGMRCPAQQLAGSQSAVSFAFFAARLFSSRIDRYSLTQPPTQPPTHPDPSRRPTSLTPRLTQFCPRPYYIRPGPFHQDIIYITAVSLLSGCLTVYPA